MNEPTSEFRCGYCNMAELEYRPIVTHLSPDEQYGYEVPAETIADGWIWVEQEEEEGYYCRFCHSHNSVEEVYWWTEGEVDPLDSTS